MLRSAHFECLKLAAEKKLVGISFPSISTGAYGYHVEGATKVALGTVVLFLKEQATSLEEVVFILFDSRTYESYLSALPDAIGRSKA